MRTSSVSTGLLSLVLTAAPSSAIILWASSYNDHTVTTLSLNSSGLTILGKSTDCGTEPTWLTLDKPKSILYCLNEGWNGNASITSYKTAADGSLKVLDDIPVLKSPVSSILYGPDKSGLAVAHYDTSTFSTFSVADPTAITLSQNETYTLAAPGPVPDRQDAPHLHNTVLDPTSKFILVPDLGSDLVHLYKIESGSIKWDELTPIKAVPGSGPRHAAFAKVGRKLYFYTVNELGNSITGYSVAYGTDGVPAFTRIFDINTHGAGASVPAGTKASEIHVSPDNNYIIVASRLESSLSIANFDSSNSTQIPSDPLITHKINSDGTLTVVQTFPAGGVDPRGFNLNKAGTLVVSALQDDNRVVVIKRDVATGKLGPGFLGVATVGDGAGNGPNYAIFDE